MPGAVASTSQQLRCPAKVPRGWLVPITGGEFFACRSDETFVLLGGASKATFLDDLPEAVSSLFRLAMAVMYDCRSQVKAALDGLVGGMLLPIFFSGPLHRGGRKPSGPLFSRAVKRLKVPSSFLLMSSWRSPHPTETWERRHRAHEMCPELQAEAGDHSNEWQRAALNQEAKRRSYEDWKRSASEFLGVAFKTQFVESSTCSMTLQYHHAS